VNNELKEKIKELIAYSELADFSKLPIKIIHDYVKCKSDLKKELEKEE
jgi:ABC-type polysaccharide/polyol phosphate transport system ATPase subunit